MKPMNLFTKWSCTLCLSALALIMQGCTKEDLSDCNINVRFRYTRNIEGKDKFHSDVDKINLYVFDSDGLFIGEYSDQGNHLTENYVMRIPLPSGKYTFVAWGNQKEDYFTTDFSVGKTKYSDAVLSLKRASTNIVDTHPGDIYHGQEYNIDAKANEKDFVLIDLIKNTNNVRVIAKGLPINTKAMPANGTLYSCAITSKNADYKFDNSIASGDRLEYIPQYSLENRQLISEFVILRELNDGSTDSKLVISEHGTGGGINKILLNQDLTPLLLKASKTGDLDIDDYYEIIVEFEFATNGNVTITINGWTVVGGGGIIG